MASDRLAEVVPSTAPLRLEDARIWKAKHPSPARLELPLPWGFALGCVALWCWAVWRAVRGER